MKILKLGAFLTSLVDMHVIVSMEPQVRYELKVLNLNSFN